MAEAGLISSERIRGTGPLTAASADAGSERIGNISMASGIRKFAGIERGAASRNLGNPLRQPRPQLLGFLLIRRSARQIDVLERIGPTVVHHVLLIAIGAVDCLPPRHFRSRYGISVLRSAQPASRDELAHLEIRLIAPAFRFP